jgi:pyridoxine 4-dehydrogenase
MHRYFTAYPEDASKVVLCIKSGIVSMKTFEVDCSVAAMRRMLSTANSILDGKKKIDIFGCARVDPKVPIEETVEGLGELVREGKIGGIQLSEVSAATIRRATKIYNIDMVEAEVSLWATDIFCNGVAETCADLGIVVVAHTPLGAGMLTGKIQSAIDLPADSHHRFFPRFQGDNLEKNIALVRRLEEMAAKKGCTTAQLALSWIKAKGKSDGMPFLVPIAGARSEQRVKENCKDVLLVEEDLKEIENILERFPVTGARYPATAKLAEY